VLQGPLQHLKSIVLLVETCRGQQQLQQQLVGAVCGALRDRTALWQFSELLQLVSALRSAQPLQQQVQEAIVESAFGNMAVLAVQTGASMLELSGLLLQIARFKEAYHGLFAVAAARHPSSYDLLLQLLQSHDKADGTAVELLIKATTTVLRSTSSITMFSSAAFTWPSLEPGAWSQTAILPTAQDMRCQLIVDVCYVVAWPKALPKQRCNMLVLMLRVSAAKATLLAGVFPATLHMYGL